MNPIIIAAAAVGVYFVAKGKSGPPTAALIPDIKGLTPVVTDVAPTTELPDGAKQYTYRFSKGTATVYGYWIVVDGKDKSSWISYAASSDTQPRQIVMSHGDPSKTVAMASYFKVQTAGNWNPLNPGF